MKILLIGGGNMGLTYATSFLKAHVAKAEDMMILEKSEERAAELATQNIGTVYGNPKDCLPKAEIVILAVKPQDTTVLFESIRPFVHEEQVFLTIMAGVKMSTIAKALNCEKIIRAMPNLPAQIGMGMTAFTAAAAVSRIELVTVQNLLNTTGKTVYLDDENKIDAATAISGSGPAYVYFFMQAMIEAAQKLGFSASQAELLVEQTFMGSVHLQNRNDLSCAQWIQKVASKGGTTEAALKTFKENALYEGIIAGAEAAFKRAVELSIKE
jgi:pyrroline-5-carboxylate reductase